jgi:Polyglycine hydrolase-like, structural repeat
MPRTTFLKLVILFASLLLLSPVLGEFWQKPLVPRSSTVARTRLTSEQYEHVSKDLLEQSYRVTYISGYTVRNEPHFAVVWELPSRPTNSSQIVKLGMNSSEYQTHFDTIVSKGYRLVLVNGYTVNGSDQYVAVWDNAPSPPWVARHGMTAIDLQTTFNTLVALGYRSTHLCGYDVHGEAHYAAIWVKRSGPLWSAWAGMTERMFQERIDVLRAHGYHLVDVAGYGVNGRKFYAGVWKYHGESKKDDWIESHGMRHRDFQKQLLRNAEAGYSLGVLSGYTDYDFDYYAAIWVRKT